MRNTTKRIRDHRGVILKPLHEDHEPIPGDVEARFTKDKQAQTLHQVFVETAAREVIAVSPKMISQAADAILVAVNKAIIDGKRPGWGNAHIQSIAA